ncbi:MAG: M56 family metallopeptidase [Planctomycetes bacterium]|nr:M56 family metallopeptidase [Planctomycetota bacterium]
MSQALALLEAMAEHGPRLLLGVSIVLGGGCLLCCLQRRADSRRRLGIWTAIGGGLYLAIAIVPLPRLLTPLPGTGHESVMHLEPEPSPRPTPSIRMVAADDGADRVTGAEPSGASLTPPQAERDHRPPAGVAPESDRQRTDEAAIAAARRAAATAAPMPWRLAIAALWGAASILLLGHHLLGALRLCRILRHCHAAPTALRVQGNLPARVRLALTHLPVRPFCTGWLRPVIVLPADLAAPARTSQASSVLRHEAAHLRARDPLVQSMFAVLSLPLCLHPLFWWLRTDVRFQSELLADERAAGRARTDYARDLLDFVDAATARPHTAGTVAVFHRPSAFYRRIQMLLRTRSNPPRPESKMRRAGHLVTLLTLVAAAAGTFGVPLAAQGTADGARLRALQAEREQLEVTIAELRAEVTRLSDQLASRAAARAVPGPGVTGVPPLPRTPAPEEPQAPTPNRPQPPVAEAAPETPPPPAVVPFLGNIPLLREMTANQPEPDAPLPVETTAVGFDSSAEATADLASRLIDIDTELELVNGELADLKAHEEAGIPSLQSKRELAARVRNLERKRSIARKLVDGEIDAAKIELKWLTRKVKEADRTERLRFEMRIERVKNRMTVLRSVM